MRSIVGGCGEILPRLFSKFVTKPETGTGLVRVVYIKNIVCGPPSSGKSLFMSSLTRLERSYYAVGSSSTKSGIFDYLFEGLFVIPPPSSKLGEIGEGIRSKVIDDFSLRESISICVRTSKIIGSITYDAVYYSGGYYEYAYVFLLILPVHLEIVCPIFYWVRPPLL